MNNYQTWLETPGVVRIALVRVEYQTGTTINTEFLSTHSAVVSGVQYLPIVKSNITIDESISTNYSASISYGDIEIANNNGDYDSWLNRIWVNKSIKIYIGQLPAPGTSPVLADFELVFDGLVDDIDSKGRTSLNLKIRDKLEKVNTSISEALLGNYNPRQLTGNYTNQYQNNLKPLCFGEVHNITPLLTEPVLLEYMVHAGTIEQIIEVRDNGIPVPFDLTGTIAIPAGSFRLKKSPVGAVTCSVQGYKSGTYSSTASNIIKTILLNYGKGLSAAEIDSTSFATAGNEAVGVYVTDRANVLQLCQEIAKSCGLILSTTRLGQLKLIDLNIPAAGSTTTAITESDMFVNTLQISQKVDIIAGVKLGYAKNWTVQPNLLTAIPQEHKDLFATEWLEANAKDDSVKSAYSITVEPALENTYLIDKAQAENVASKKLTLFKAQRKIITMTCTAKMLSVQVGDPVTVTASRFNLSGGVNGIVVSTKPDWLSGSIEIGVLI